jgi:hypothetical protein
MQSVGFVAEMTEDDADDRHELHAAAGFCARICN